MADPTDIIDTPFGSALEQRYLVYAMSTITARSLPDVRDGLKPVHRRLLWGMRLLRLEPGFRIGEYLLTRIPYLEPTLRARCAEHLRKAGLPE